jgi:signal transduction histidine kinase
VPYPHGMGWPKVTALALAPLTAALAGIAITGQIVAGSTADTAYVAVTAIVAVGTLGLSWVAAIKQPGNALAAVIACMSLVIGVDAVSESYPEAVVRSGGTLPAIPTEVLLVTSAHWAWMYTALMTLVYLFPTGRALTRRWSWAARGLVLVAAGIQCFFVFLPAPTGPGVPLVWGTLPRFVAVALQVAFFPTFIVLMLGAPTSLVLRYRRGDQRTRGQVKWMLLTLPLLPLTLVLSWGGFLIVGSNALAGIGIAAMFLAMPAATVVAVLRHDLFDVDRAIVAAAVYTILTGAVIGVFGATAALSGALLGRQSPVLSALVAAGAALAFGPARRRLQKVVDRRLYPARQRVQEALSDLERRVFTGEAEPEQIEATLREALRDPSLHVTVTDSPEAGAAISVQGQPIGAISANGVSPHLLAEVARDGALLVELVRLRAEATRAVREAKESRARVQQVGYEERRKLERDLHDVAQQRLVALAISMRLAQRRLNAGSDLSSDDANALIAEWVNEVTTSTRELRDLAHGIRPSCLDDGLRAALQMLAQRVPMPMDTNVAAVSNLDDTINTTAYYVAAESVANAMRHAGASRLALNVSEQSSWLVVTCTDDGTGGARVGREGGLSSLSDRVAAAGGELTVDSVTGRGTTVTARLPIDPEEQTCAS